VAAALGLLVAAQAAGAAEIVDDARRRVELPSEVSRVFAAGFPAEILLYTLVPEKLGGRNHQPSADALSFIAPEYRSLPQITTLPELDDPRYDRELLALRPDVYVDYGTVDDDYIGALEAISGRTGVPGVIFDGRLDNIPAVYRRLGAALGVAPRGERLAAEAERVLAKYRGALTAAAVRVYLACSQNGTMPCVEGVSSGEAAQWLGAINVAGTTDTAPRRALTVDEIRAGMPAIVVAASAASAAELRADPQWQDIVKLVHGRIYAPPILPFNWGPRPPSVNRLLGLMWLAYVLPGRDFDAVFFDDVRSFFDAFYHVAVTDEQVRELLAN
jgi:iron complex transport system substrate-binding protein